MRDLGYAVDSVATTTSLRRIQQGPFTEADCLPKEQWKADDIFAAIDRFNLRRTQESGENDASTSSSE